MSQRTAAEGNTQFRDLFRSLVLDPGLLFAHILSAEMLAKIVLEEVGETCDRIFTPLVQVSHIWRWLGTCALMRDRRTVCPVAAG